MMLALTTAVVVGIAVPLVLPHLAHPSMIYHIALHIASITIAVFLSIVSILAYTRNASARMMMLEIPEINVELPHIILLVMLTMFGLGVLKVNK